MKEAYYKCHSLDSPILCVIYGLPGANVVNLKSTNSPHNLRNLKCDP